MGRLLEYFMNKWPYTDFHELNADWLLSSEKELIEIMDSFIQNESISFADPIVWNITTQYTKATVVIDTSGNAYLSKQPVPSGIQLNNIEYWQEIFNFTNYTRTANRNLTVNVETNTTRATSPYSVDDWLIWNDVLYKVTKAIAIDDILIASPAARANIVHFTVEDFIKAFITYITNAFNQFTYNSTQTINQYKSDIDASETAYQLAMRAEVDRILAGATVDSELIDARLGYCGCNFSTLGMALRTQIGDISILKNIDWLSLGLDDGYIGTTGQFVSNNSFKVTDYLPIENNIAFIRGYFDNISSPYAHLHMYAEDHTYLGSEMTYVNSPYNYAYAKPFKFADDVKYIRVVIHNSHYEELYVGTSKNNKYEVSKSGSEGYINQYGDLVSMSSFKTTDFIIADHVYLTGRLQALNGFNYISCYDDDLNYIGGTLLGDGSVNTYNNQRVDGLPGTYAIKVTDQQSDTGYRSLTIEVDYPNSIKDNQALDDDYLKKVYTNLYGWYGFGAFDKFATIGDSLSVGYHTKRDNTVVSSDLPHSWPAVVERMTGAVANWTGVSGGTSKSWLESTSPTEGLPYAQSLGTMPLYVYCMGANEGSIPIGTRADIDGASPTTLYGYVSKVINKLKAISPHAIILCTGVSRMQSNAPTINQVYRDVCNRKTNCFYIDCENEFNNELYSYYNDHHYTVVGYNLIAKMFQSKLIEVMKNNPATFLHCE